MASTSHDSSADGVDDDVIVVPDSPPVDRRSINFLLNHAADRSSARPASRAERSHQRRAVPSQASTQIPTDVIDLTEEPDSPVETRTSGTSSPWASGQNRRPGEAPTNRHPRRTNSTRISPPMLTRSDSTLMGGRHSIIDLTEDSPEDTRPFQLPRALRHTPGAPRLSSTNRSNPPHHHHHVHGRPRHQRTDEIVEVVTAVDTLNEFVQTSLRQFHRMPRLGGLAASFTNIRPFNPPNLDFSRNAFAAPVAREESPQPPMDPVPPPRNGFTRDTHAQQDGEELETVAVCPACEDELAYDPTDVTAQKNGSEGSTAAGKKRKRAPGEHHFWALKKCGHVYCADCFENRKPTKQRPNGVGFQLPSGKTGSAAFNDMRCSVDGCDTKVSAKGEWVGIFL